MKTINIIARDIPDAWFQCIFNILDNGFKYIIDQGSYASDQRLEFDDVRVKITYPEVKPFEPDIPPAYGMPNPVAPGYIETYFQEKILVGIKDANEDYVYGERLSGVLINRHDGIMDDPVIVGPDQIGAVVEKYKKYGFNTNQTTMEVGRPEDCLLNDPPCLRLIDCRVRYGNFISLSTFVHGICGEDFPRILGHCRC